MLKSLPPTASGLRRGTLTVRLVSRAAPGTSVLLQFWGETGPSSELTRDLCEVEYTLVGSLAALSQYLKDASPLRLHFFTSAADGEGKRLVGSGQLDLAEESERLLLLNNNEARESVRVSFAKRAHIADDYGNSYGSAGFVLDFHTNSAQSATAPIPPLFSLHPNSRRNLAQSVYIAERGGTLLQVLHHLLQQSHKTVNGVPISVSTAKWMKWSIVPAGLLSRDAAIIVPQLCETGIQVHNAGNLADLLRLTGKNKMSSLLYFLTNIKENLGAILLSYNKVEGTIAPLPVKKTGQALGRDTRLVIGLGPSNLLKPSTPRADLNVKVADPDRLRDVLAREVR